MFLIGSNLWKNNHQKLNCFCLSNKIWKAYQMVSHFLGICSLFFQHLITKITIYVDIWWIFNTILVLWKLEILIKYVRVHSLLCSMNSMCKIKYLLLCTVVLHCCLLLYYIVVYCCITLFTVVLHCCLLLYYIVVYCCITLLFTAVLHCCLLLYYIVDLLSQPWLGVLLFCSSLVTRLIESNNRTLHVSCLLFCAIPKIVVVLFEVSWYVVCLCM